MTCAPAVAAVPAGALQDLRTAISLEQDLARRDSMVNLLRLLEGPQ